MIRREENPETAIIEFLNNFQILPYIRKGTGRFIKILLWIASQKKKTYYPSSRIYNR